MIYEPIRTIYRRVSVAEYAASDQSEENVVCIIRGEIVAIDTIDPELNLYRLNLENFDTRLYTGDHDIYINLNPTINLLTQISAQPILSDTTEWCALPLSEDIFNWYQFANRDSGYLGYYQDGPWQGKAYTAHHIRDGIPDYGKRTRNLRK